MTRTPIFVGLGLAAIGSVVACFSVDFGDGKLECGANGSCPSGLTCSSVDNRCHQNVQPGQPDASITPIDGSNAADTGAPDVASVAQPLIHYTFDNNLNDTGTKGNAAGTGSAGQSYVTGKFNQAAHFPSNVDYLLIPNNKMILAGASNAYTIAFWVNGTSSANALAISNQQHSAAPYGGVGIELISGALYLCASNSTTSLIGGSCGAVGAGLSAGVWHSVVIEWNGTDILVYTDGVRSDTGNYMGAGDVFNAGVDTNIQVGGGGLGVGVDVDDLKVYTQVFDAQHRCTDVIGGTYAASTCTLP